MIGPVPPPLHNDADAPSKRKRLVRLAVLVGLLAVAITTGVWWYSSRTNATTLVAAGVPTGAAQTDSTARAPTGVRIRVRVVNTTRTDGLAKRATAMLREQGFDVVDYEGDARKTLDTTLVLTHTGHADWSDRIVRALGAGRAENRPDSSRYLDITVMLGSDWKATAQPFRP